jgi:HEAT repeat protein
MRRRVSSQRFLRAKSLGAVLLLMAWALSRAAAVLAADKETLAGPVPAAVEVLERALKTSLSVRLRQVAFETLAALRCQGSTSEAGCAALVEEAARSEDATLRSAALVAAFGMGSNELRGRVVTLLHTDTDPIILRLLSRFLLDHPTVGDRQLLESLAASRDAVVRTHALATLVRRGEVTARRDLVRQLEHSEVEASIEAARDLCIVQGEGTDAARRLLMAFTRHTDELMRANAVAAASEAPGIGWNRSDIERIGSDASPLVRLVTVRGLRGFVGPDFSAGDLVAFVRARWARESAEAVRLELLRAAAEETGYTAKQQGQAFVQEVVRNESGGELRLVAQGLLAAQGDPRYCADLEDVMLHSSDSPDARLIAIRLLAQAPGCPVTDSLVKIMAGDNDEARRVAAAAAIVARSLDRGRHLTAGVNG